LPPKVEVGDYQELNLTPEPVELTDDEINATIEQLRHQQANWEPVERPIEFNDLAVIDVEGSVEEKPIVEQNGVQYQITHDSAVPLPGFAEQLIGMKADEEKEFKLQFPSDYPRGELADKEASFKVKVKEVKEEKLPELSDEFAQEINPEFKTMDLLRAHISSQLKLRAEEQARAAFEERLLEAVVDQAELEFPPILVEVEINRLLEQQARRWQMLGGGLEGYLKSANKTEEELREELRPEARKRVSRSLVLEKVAEKEKIEVSDEEVEVEIENMIRSATDENKDEMQKFMNTPQAKESVKQILIARKTKQRLVEIAKGEKSIEIIKEGEKE
jgi:trigger factor